MGKFGAVVWVFMLLVGITFAASIPEEKKSQDQKLSLPEEKTPKENSSIMKIESRPTVNSPVDVMYMAFRVVKNLTKQVTTDLQRLVEFLKWARYMQVQYQQGKFKAPNLLYILHLLDPKHKPHLLPFPDGPVKFNNKLREHRDDVDTANAASVTVKDAHTAVSEDVDNDLNKNLDDKKDEVQNNDKGKAKENRENKQKTEGQSEAENDKEDIEGTFITALKDCFAYLIN